MIRNIDLTALRAFVTVAEVGGVTRAAGVLALTQSAVSMQLKRLEEALGQTLLERSGRGVALTAAGEQLLGYGRRMLALNDEVWGRLTHNAYEGELVLGVPGDIVYPHIPGVLRRFALAYPRVRVRLNSSYTRPLKHCYARGECDLVLTTESGCDTGGETLAMLPLVWVGAADGVAWKARPLRLAFEHNCIFRAEVQRTLDAAGIAWEMAVESDTTRTIEASVTADLAVTAVLAGSMGPHMAAVAHGGALPDLRTIRINLYGAARTPSTIKTALADMLRAAYACAA